MSHPGLRNIATAACSSIPGVLTARDPYAADGDPLAVDCEAVVEWRALTVALLDRLARLVQHRIGGAWPCHLQAFWRAEPWAAGRRIAQQKELDGRPPLTIVSDGSVVLDRDDFASHRHPALFLLCEHDLIRKNRLPLFGIML